METDIATNPKLAAVPLDPPDPVDNTLVSDDYTLCVREVYRKEFKNFFGRLRKHIQRERVEKRTFFYGHNVPCTSDRIVICLLSHIPDELGVKAPEPNHGNEAPRK